jgi:hypothetical protein
VANAALSVAAAVMLASLAGAGRRRASLGLFGVGGLFVVAVAFTRLYLGRHWLTDAVAGALLGTAFWGLASARPSRALRLLLVFIVSIELPGAYLAAAAGGGIQLPSPSTLLEPQRGEPPPLRDPRILDVMDGTWIPERARRSGGFARFGRRELQMCVELSERRPMVLKVVARPLRGLRGGRCRWIEAAVDGRLVSRRRLSRSWRTYAFALPRLGAGPHAVRLAFRGGATPPVAPTLALRALAIEGPDGNLPIAGSVHRCAGAGVHEETRLSCARGGR